MVKVSQTPVVDLDAISDSLLVQWKDEFKNIRQDFHRHPEIGLVTPRTSAVIAEKLKEYGVDQIETGIGGHGVVAVIKGKYPSNISIGIRADIDALPMEELSQHDHTSVVPNCMHGCGHDGHATILLAVAKYLAHTREFPGQVVLIFQPGEEGWSGAKVMMDDGLFEKYPVSEVYAVHNSSAIEPGKFALNYGAMQAAADAFTITVTGSGGHASRPQLNHDPVLTAAHILVALQSIVSRNVDPNETAVISCCSIHAGDPRAQSVCPEKCEIVGTVRTFSPEVQDLIEKRMNEVCTLVAQSMQCEAQLHYQRFYPPCINDASLAKEVADIASAMVGENNVDRNYPQMPGGEDFAFMLQKYPGVYLRVGQGGAPAHNGLFDFNDEIIVPTATLLSRVVIHRLNTLNTSV